MTAEAYVAQHPHIFYCEALLHRDGSIEDACPSHQEAAIRLYLDKTDISYDAFMADMQTEVDPVGFLLYETGVCFIWYRFGQTVHELSEAQQATLLVLNKAGIIDWLEPIPYLYRPELQHSLLMMKED